MLNLKKFSLLALIAALINCTAVDGDKSPGSPPPACDNDVCEAGETAETCPQDCQGTPTTCDNDGQCEAGESTVSCPNDCGADLYPSWDYANSVCYPYRKNGVWRWNCGASHMGNAATARYVGGCRPLNVCNYGDQGTYIPVTNVNGRYEAVFDNTMPVGTICEQTYNVCPDENNMACWAQYWQIMGALNRFMQCGPRTKNGVTKNACAQFFRIVGPNSFPEPIPAYLAAPPC